MSTDQRLDPVMACNFRITLLDSTSPLAAVGTVALSSVLSHTVAGFAECTGLDMVLDVQEYMQGGGNETVLKFPTRIKPATLVLKRGLTTKTDLWSWFYGFVQGRGRRRDGLIIVQDAAHQPHTVWGFRNGLPTKYAGPQLNASHSAVAIESIEIAHEGLYQMGGAGALAQAVSEAAGAVAGLFR
jgi:phage tail-like protein